ncbi:ABC transporter permease [Actinomadura syzygii]|uniref:ABC transporter permease n=1 Tax=Actinomadura syzygii TaxID=1427538 RepID=UPI001FE9CB9B|nr:ABC transporter permease subunit [Actinomadura syzygii]
MDRSFLPPASSVTARAVELFGDSDFLSNVRVTLTAWALGLAIAVAIAVPLGLLLGSVPAVNTAVRAIVEFLRPIPSVALIPLAGLILGSGLNMEVPLIVYACCWPILFNTMYGLHDVDPLAKETLRSFGFNRMQVLIRVSLRSAAPFIATGVRLSASVALILAVGTEILSGFGDGLGMFIAQAGTVPEGTRDVLAGTVWAGCIGLIIDTVLVQAENRAFRWHLAQRSGAS